MGLLTDRVRLGLGVLTDEIIEDDAADHKDVKGQHDDEHARKSGVGLVLVPFALFGDKGGDVMAAFFFADEIG